MKLKYFLRGLGTGIVFGALIMLVAYMTAGNKISDKEIIERAENLGMVKAEDYVITSSKTDTEEDTEEDIKNTASAGDSSEIILPGIIGGTSESTTESELSLLDGITTEFGTEEATTEEATTEKATTEDKPKDSSQLVTAKITVTSGMTSSEVSMILQNAGIIDDYLDFDEYLNKNGYSTQIKINDYEFNSGMSYEEIAKALIKEDKAQ